MVDATEIQTLIQALQNADSAEQCTAAWKLYDIGDEQAVDALVLALDSEDWAVQNAAAWTLAKIKSKKAIAPLLSKFEQADQRTRVRMIELLAELADESLMEFFIDKLGDENGFIRAIALTGLGRIGNKETIPLLIKALHDSEDFVRVTAIDVLRNVGNFSIVPYLKPLLQDTHEEVRFITAIALRDLGWLPENTQEEIDYFIVWEQWSLLVEHGEMAIAPLTRTLSADVGDFSKFKATEVLVQIQYSKACSYLTKQGTVRPLGIAWLYSSEAGKALLDIINTIDNEIRAEAIYAVFQQMLWHMRWSQYPETENKIILALKAILQYDEYPEMQSTATYLLSKLEAYNK